MIPPEDKLTMRVLSPEGLPHPLRLVVECPCCGADIEYEPAEDDAGSFYACEEWPVCEPCDVLIDVPPISIRREEGTYHVRGGGR